MLMAHMCREWRCLPNAGGLYDQDPVHVAVMTAYAEAIHAKQEREAKSMKNRRR